MVSTDFLSVYITFLFSCTFWLPNCAATIQEITYTIPTVALFPGLPHLRSQQYTASEERGRPGSIHQVNDVRWTRDGRRGGGAQLPKQRTGSSIRALYRSFVLQTLAWSRLPTRLDSKKNAFKFSIGPFPPPSRPPHIHSCDECSQAFPVFFCQSSAPVHYCECKRKIKMGGGLGTRLYLLHLSHPG